MRGRQDVNRNRHIHKCKQGTHTCLTNQRLFEWRDRKKSNWKEEKKKKILQGNKQDCIPVPWQAATISGQHQTWGFSLTTRQGASEEVPCFQWSVRKVHSIKCLKECCTVYKWQRIHVGGGREILTFFPVSRLITETFSSPVRQCGSSLLGSNRGLLPLRLDSGNSSNSSCYMQNINKEMSLQRIKTNQGEEKQRSEILHTIQPVKYHTVEPRNSEIGGQSEKNWFWENYVAEKSDSTDGECIAK